MNTPMPRADANVVPTELIDEQKDNLDAAVSAGPSETAKGFAATCNAAIPKANTKIASKNSGYENSDEAGRKRKQPTVNKLKLNWITLTYPFLPIIYAVGKQTINGAI